MKRGTRFLTGFAAAVITFATLTAFVGPRYHIGWRDGYGGDGYYHYGWQHYPYYWQPYRNYWQQPPYPPSSDSAYIRPLPPNSHQ